jgi:hypothetical protein
MFLITFGLSVELVGNKRKTLVGNLAQGWFAVGEALVGVLALGIREWRTLQVIQYKKIIIDSFSGLCKFRNILPKSHQFKALVTHTILTHNIAI